MLVADPSATSTRIFIVVVYGLPFVTIGVLPFVTIERS